jgi:hypothetical protein
LYSERVGFVGLSFQPLLFRASRGRCWLALQQRHFSLDDRLLLEFRAPTDYFNGENQKPAWFRLCLGGKPEQCRSAFALDSTSAISALIKRWLQQYLKSI